MLLFSLNKSPLDIIWGIHIKVDFKKKFNGHIQIQKEGWLFEEQPEEKGDKDQAFKMLSES